MRICVNSALITLCLDEQFNRRNRGYFAVRVPGEKGRCIGKSCTESHLNLRYLRETNIFISAQTSRGTISASRNAPAGWLFSAVADMAVLKILLVEDNPGDVQLLRTALTHHSFPCTLRTFDNGRDALKFLSTCDESTCPDLVLLDLNLPGLAGHEVLSHIKSDERTRRLPVVIMSSSKARTDIARAYDEHANGYIRKPANLDELYNLVEALYKFWAHSVLPSQLLFP
jgi:two-component system, chemotaxis family, response regulator Rcp1